MHAPKQAHRSTEFYLTVGGLVAAAVGTLFEPMGAAILASACIASYNLSRGIMKAGYGAAANVKPPRVL